jgi:hypothetical protein
VSGSIRLTEVLGAPVNVDGARVGEVAAVVADAALERVVGLEVVGVDFRRKFLPWVAFTFAHRVVQPTSALVLFEMSELDDLRRLGARLVQDEDLERLEVAVDGRILAPNGRVPAGSEVMQRAPS